MIAKSKYSIVSYALYDAGNSNYATLIPSLAFPLYFKNIIAPNLDSVDLVWGIIISISTLIAAIIGPKIGEIVDCKNLKQSILRWTSWLAIMGTIGLYFLSKGQIILAATIFITTNTCFLLAVFLYDATLADVSSKKNSGMISSFAWAIGYIGGLIGLFFVLSIKGTEVEILRQTLLVAAVLFFILSLPLLLFKHRHQPQAFNPRRNYRSGRSILLNFMKDKTRANLFWAYFMYSNGISAVIYFTSIYATNTLGYSINHLLWLFVAMSLVAIPSVIFFGKLANSWGHIKTLKLVIGCWIIIVIAVAFSNKATFAIVACIAAGFLGPVQALSRSLFRIIFPTDSMSSFFGIQSIAARSSALVGPLLFGIVSFAMGSQRFAILTTSILLIIGFALLFKIPKNYERENI